MNYVGIDIGGTNIKAGLVDDSGAVRDARRMPSVIDDIDGLLRTLTTIVSDFQSHASIEAIGIGIPGLRSTRTHLIETSPNIPCIHNLNLEALLSKQLNLPVISENDANAGAYGEWVAGAGRGLQYMAYLTHRNRPGLWTRAFRRFVSGSLRICRRNWVTSTSNPTDGRAPAVRSAASKRESPHPA